MDPSLQGAAPGPAVSIPADPDTRAGLARAARGQALSARLDSLAVVQFSGADAAPFLHGQLSCHVTELSPGAATWGSYSTPKGRMLATFVLARSADDYLMVVSRSIAAAVAKRLRMYVLRSKVVVTERLSDWAVAGFALEPAVRPAFPDGAWIPISAGRVLAVGPMTAVDGLLSAAEAVVPRVPEDVWQWLDVRDGLPWITARTQDHLVPQMANLDLIGGIHFQKGCYPGQEIVARTQYLGKVKRRMYRAQVPTEARPEEGTAVFGRDLGDQASGEVVNVAPSPEGGFEVLAVMHSSTAETSEARLGTTNGPRLSLLGLPYAFG